jgi:hypothetical protein
MWRKGPWMEVAFGDLETLAGRGVRLTFWVLNIHAALMRKRQYNRSQSDDMHLLVHFPFRYLQTWFDEA